VFARKDDESSVVNIRPEPLKLGQMVELVDMDHLRGTYGCVRSVGAYLRDDEFCLVSCITDDGFIYHCAPGSVRKISDTNAKKLGLNEVTMTLMHSVAEYIHSFISLHTLLWYVQWWGWWALLLIVPFIHVAVYILAKFRPNLAANVAPFSAKVGVVGFLAVQPYLGGQADILTCIVFVVIESCAFGLMGRMASKLDRQQIRLLWFALGLSVALYEIRNGQYWAVNTALIIEVCADGVSKRALHADWIYLSTMVCVGPCPVVYFQDP
jgi:hypothetical protein